MIDRATLRFIREYIGLSTYEVARLIGYGQSTVSMIENGQRRITERYLKAFLSAFDFTVQDFN